MSKIIAFANHKGGVGKTTSVASLGAALARRGKRTLIVDLDSQQNLTFSFLQEDEVEGSVYEAFTGKGEFPIVHLRECLDLAPSSLEMGLADIELSTKLAREGILRRLLQPLADKYEYILLDCPPSLGIVTTNALAAAQAVYIPLTAEALPLKGMRMLDQVVDGLREAINPGLRLGGVFVTRYNGRKNLNNAILDTIKARYGEVVFETRIRENVALAECPLKGEDIFTYAPGSNGAKDYESLAEEILSRGENV